MGGKYSAFVERYLCSSARYRGVKESIMHNKIFSGDCLAEGHSVRCNLFTDRVSNNGAMDQETSLK